MTTYKMTVELCEYSENPREWDNLGKMVCFHKRMNLGDKQNDYLPNNYTSFEELEKAIRENENVHTILPIYLYDHSGITISTNSFNCNFDSGKIGFIYITNETVKYEKIDKNKVKEYLINEVKVYDQYLRGECYEYIIHEVSTCNLGHEHSIEIESCGGYFDENICIKDGKSMLEYYNDQILINN